MNKKTITTKNTGAIDSITKRWAVYRKSTGKLIRAFTNRDAARASRRTHGLNKTFMMDQFRQVAVR